MISTNVVSLIRTANGLALLSEGVLTFLMVFSAAVMTFSLIPSLSGVDISVTVSGFFINRFADYWNELINDTSLLDIRFPPEDTIQKKETSQTENQIKKNLNRYF